MSQKIKRVTFFLRHSVYAKYATYIHNGLVHTNNKMCRNSLRISFAVALEEEAEVLLAVFVGRVHARTWHYHYLPTTTPTHTPRVQTQHKH